MSDLLDDAPSFYDREMPAEAYIGRDNEIHIIVPSDIWVTSDQAEAFGKALIAIAEWLRNSGMSRKFEGETNG